MNQKQFITMWCGITAVVIAGLAVIKNYGLMCSYGFSVWVFTVALVTGGLIYTLRDNRRKAKNTMQNIRGNLLKKKRFKMRKDNYVKDN